MENTRIRLQKYLSQAGICSRRKAEEYISQGEVLVNGEKAVLGMTIDPDQDTVTLGKKTVADREAHVYYKLNKPYGIVTTCKQDGESSIMDIVDIPERVFPIGRLDKNSTGLILLTNDGRLSNYLMHPRYEHEKEYVVQVYGAIENADLIRMSKGIGILGKTTKPAEITRLNSGMFSIVLREGMNRQIRRMVEAVGHQVKKLIRVRIENIQLGNLKEGASARLTGKEIKGLEEKLGIRLSQ